MKNFWKRFDYQDALLKLFILHLTRLTKAGMLNDKNEHFLEAIALGQVANEYNRYKFWFQRPLVAPSAFSLSEEDRKLLALKNPEFKDKKSLEKLWGKRYV